MHKETPHMNLLTLSIMPHVPLTSSKCTMPVHDCVTRSSSVTNMLCSLPQASLRELNCYTSPPQKRRSDWTTCMLHAQRNAPHESFDSLHHPHVPLTSSKCTMPVHYCVKRSSSVTNMLCSLPQSGIIKRVKLLHITTAEKKIRLDNLHAACTKKRPT